MSYDCDCTPKTLTPANPAYKRALWIVVILNFGMGVVELICGFLTGSQALKADALDFLGDGTITLLGLLAVGWAAVWRSRAAMLQGIFLGVLGIGVLASTIYHVFFVYEPSAEIMGIIGLIALVVNVASAYVLLPHRSGDDNVRAVWLFSRNDAIGNAAVVMAAILIWLFASSWPDLIVAAGIAALFLHSAFDIIRDCVAGTASVAVPACPVGPTSIGAHMEPTATASSLTTRRCP